MIDDPTACRKGVTASPELGPRRLNQSASKTDQEGFEAVEKIKQPSKFIQPVWEPLQVSRVGTCVLSKQGQLLMIGIRHGPSLVNSRPTTQLTRSLCLHLGPSAARGIFPKVQSVLFPEPDTNRPDPDDSSVSCGLSTGVPLGHPGAYVQANTYSSRTAGREGRERERDAKGAWRCMVWLQGLIMGSSAISLGAASAVLGLAATLAVLCCFDSTYVHCTFPNGNFLVEMRLWIVSVDHAIRKTCFGSWDDNFCALRCGF